MDGIEGAATPVAASEELRLDPAVKHCIGCGVAVVRKPTERNWNWNRRRFCTRVCGAKAAARDPAWRARVSAALKTKLATDPAFRANLCARGTANLLVVSKTACRKKSGLMRSRRMLGWLPDDLRPTYVRMREQFGAAEARRMAKEEVDARARRQVAQFTRDQLARAAREKSQAY